MSEQFALNMLVLNGRNYHKYGDEQFKNDFHFWMHRLHKIKGFTTIEETCNYFGRYGNSLGVQAAGPNIW